MVDLKELKRYATSVLSKTCIDVQHLEAGVSFDVFVLSFSVGRMYAGSSIPSVDDEWTCIARVCLEYQDVAKLMSEVETMRYIKEKTSIPVPCVYSYDFDTGNSVGAQFMLIEHLPGLPLYKVWPQLTLDHKKSVISDIASLLAELSNLTFDKIGCLTSGGKIGSLLSPLPKGEITATGPFTLTSDYLLSFLPSNTCPSGVYSRVRRILLSYVSQTENTSLLAPPFRIIHTDFDAQNILLLPPISGTDPKVSGIIDWEFAYTGPPCFFYDYPVFIQDSEDNDSAHWENETLRTLFSEKLVNSFPPKESVVPLKCMEKRNVLDAFRERIMNMICYSEVERTEMAETYVDELWGGMGGEHE